MAENTRRFGSLGKRAEGRLRGVNSEQKAPVLVVDLGSPHAQLVARRVRDAGIYTEVAGDLDASKLQETPPAAIVTVGDSDFGDLAGMAADLGVPLLSLPAAEALERVEEAVQLAKGLPEAAPWDLEQVRSDLVQDIRDQVGDGRVIAALSGGVDSSVTAALVHEAVGDQLTCVFVDHGLLRSGEREQIERDYAQTLGIRLITIDAVERFLSALKGVTDPETKRKIIGTEFIRVFEEAAADLMAEATREGATVDFLAQGTVYPDVIESGVGGANVKSHHNVGGLPDDLQFELVEPLRDLFKDEVRALGRLVGVPNSIVERHPFPGPGLGVRVVGELTPENLEMLRAADKIVREETEAAGLNNDIWQFPVVLLADVRSTGVTDEERTYGHPIVLRPIRSEDAMSAEWYPLPYDLVSLISNRITGEVEGVNRVVLDVTPKPPGTIEWE